MYGERKNKAKLKGFNTNLIMNNSFEDFSKAKKNSSRNNSITHYCNKLLTGQSQNLLNSKKYSISKQNKKVGREIPNNLWSENNQSSDQRTIKWDQKSSKSRMNKMEFNSYNLWPPSYNNKNKPNSSLSWYTENLNQKKNLRK